EMLSEATLDLLPAPAFLTAVPGGSILRCNRRASALCGRPSSPAGTPLPELLHAVATDGTQTVGGPDPVRTALYHGARLEDAECTLDRANGPIAVSISIEPVSGADGRIVAALTVCHPIGRWSRTHHAAVFRRRSEERLTLALSAGKLGAWEFDLDTRLLSASAQCKANHGLPPDADLQLATQLIPAIDEQHRDRFQRAIDGAIEEQAGFEIEVPHRWPDGTAHWLLVAGRVIDPTCMVGVSLDITERRRIEQALRDSEERLRTLADNMAQLAWMADEDGWIFWYNRRWFEYTGTTLDDMEGWGWQAVHHPDHVDRVVAKIRQCFETGEVWEDTFPLRRKDGAYRWFLSRALPIRDDRGVITRWFGTNTDVTEQRRAEEELLEADRRKDEFLAVLGHELRTPLAAILTAGRILQVQGAPDPSLQRFRDTIVRQTLQLTKLVDDLLDVGRITAGKLRLDNARVELNAVVKQAAETCAPLIEQRRHSLHVRFSEGPVFLHADEARLVQVVDNLLHNAAKYMWEGGRIELIASEEAGAAVIRVRDEGVGIAEEMLTRIFQRFVQVGSSGYRADGGLGIGLSLVKALVEMHGGSVGASSEGIGKGSEFVVRLPVLTP
ncbi:MAG: PAS domain-containing sensor histidine kinase, partial [Vicinamibacterales bacterium]